MNPTDRVDRSQRFALLLSESRVTAGKTQKYMAQALGKSVNTIQNRESGIGCPNFLDLEDWFDTLGMNMNYYLLRYRYPNEFLSVNRKSSIKDLLVAVQKYISMLPDFPLEQLAFNMFGNTGSDFVEQINMLTAHNHTSMRSRSTVSRLIHDNYIFEEANSELVCEDNIKPNLDSLLHATKLGKKSALEGTHGYTNKI